MIDELHLQGWWELNELGHIEHQTELICTN